MASLLDGPRRAAASGKTSSLVVFLHGYGANGQDLFGLARPLAAALPDTAFAAPDAPERCEAGFGFQWFGLMGPGGSLRVRVAGADQAAPILAAYLAAELARYSLPPSRLALVGFSQGAMMALHVGLEWQPPLAALVGFSGLLVAPERLTARSQAEPPILLIHGSADPTVPCSALDSAAAALRAAGLEPRTLLRPGLGHGIDEAGLEAAAGFLARHLSPDLVA